MRKLCLFFAMVLYSYCSYAQNNTFPTSGNVGIGTVTPSTALEVNGTLTLQVAGARISSILPNVMVNSAARTLRFQNTSGNNDEGFQFYNASSSPASLLMIQLGGNIGIGMANPTGILDIDQGASSNGIIFSNHATGATLGSMMTFNFSRGSVSAPTAVSSTDRLGGFVFQAYDGTNYIASSSIETYVDGTVATGSVPTSIGLFTTPVGGTARVQRMNIDDNGFVGIGTTNTQGYTLGVNGTVIATSITVKAYANWADYVFKPNYKLPSLLQVENYIAKNHHLADVPTTNEIANKGLDLGEMNTILTKKVEELTLYLIEQNKQIIAQQKLTRSLQKQVDVLSKQVVKKRAGKHG